MTPGESHNEWYHYDCSSFYVFKSASAPPPKKKKTFYDFLTKTYVAGTKKNRLNETVC